MSSTERPSKQQAFLALLREGWTSLHLDARRSGRDRAGAPATGSRTWCCSTGTTCRSRSPTSRSTTTACAPRCRSRAPPHLTVVPWSAVYVVACDDGRGVLYRRGRAGRRLGHRPAREPSEAADASRPVAAELARWPATRPARCTGDGVPSGAAPPATPRIPSRARGRRARRSRARCRAPAPPPAAPPREVAARPSAWRAAARYSRTTASPRNLASSSWWARASS